MSVDCIGIGVDLSSRSSESNVEDGGSSLITTFGSFCSTNMLSEVMFGESSRGSANVLASLVVEIC